MGDKVINESKGATISNTPAEVRESEGQSHPEAELQGALKVLRALSEHVTGPFSEVLARLDFIERGLRAAAERGEPPSDAALWHLEKLREKVNLVADALRRFQYVETLCIKETPIGDVLDLYASANPDCITEP